MINFFYDLNPILQTFLASLITFFATTLGASSVYLLKGTSKMLYKILLGIAAGIMLSAAIFSLLLPAIEEAKALGFNTYLVLSSSIILGSLFLVLGEKFSNRYSNSNNGILLVTSIILHNIPEGLSIGFAFGSALNQDAIGAALSLAIGIAIQNIPEGAAVSIPLINRGKSKNKAFLMGMLSGIVEPISAVLGFLLVYNITSLLPFLLAFAAGAMIFVVIKELVPESQKDDSNLVAILSLVGFVLMMFLEL